MIKEKIYLLDKDQTVIYNRNHIKHFQTLPWWFKSNVLTKFMLHDSSSDNNIMLNEPMRKRKRLDKLENNLNDSALDEEFSLLAEFCESTKARVMEVHSVSIEIENRLQAQQLENALLEDRLKNALLEIDSTEEGI